jgi:hypothetical protein
MAIEMGLILGLLSRLIPKAFPTRLSGQDTNMTEKNGTLILEL